MAEFYTKDSYEYRMKDAAAKREHYKNRAAFEKSKGRKENAAADNAMANMAEQEQEMLQQRMYKTNSRAQYEHEKEAGDPVALRLSFEEWKKL
jgi:hypothetical protein